MKMLSMKAVADTRGFEGFKWSDMAYKLMFKVFYKYPDRDFLVTPVNLLENGDIVEAYKMEAAFDCPVLPTHFQRNLFRLYATIAFVTQKVQLGNLHDHVSRLRALKDGHPHIVRSYFSDFPDVASALNDIYSVLFKDTIVPPQSSSDPLSASDII